MSTADLPEVLPAPRSRALLPPRDVALALPVRRASLGRRLARFGVAVVGWTWRWLVGALMCFNLFVLSWLTSIAVVGWTNRVVQQLVLAADQLLVKRGAGQTVIAGYHWFGDWGRDTMIALPGLALTTRRFDLAADVLRTFARFVS